MPRQHEQSSIWTGVTAVLSGRMPTVVQQLLHLLQDGDGDLVRIEELISLDPVLAAQVIRHAQEPPAPTDSDPSTLWDGTLRLGPTSILQLCKWQADPELRSVWTEIGPRSSLLLEHSLATAAAARRLARAIYPEGEQEAYLAGLLHDIGAYAMVARHGSDYLDFTLSHKSGLDFLDRERENFGETHQDCAAILGAAWNLPPALRQVMAGHHLPISNDGPILPQIVALAEQLATSAGMSFCNAEDSEEDVQLALKRFGLPAHTVERLLPAIYEQLRRAAKTLGVSYRNPGDLAPAFLANPECAWTPQRTLGQTRSMLRESDSIRSENELGLWLRNQLLRNTHFERSFLFLLREEEAAYVEVLSEEEGLQRGPVYLEASEVDKLGFPSGRFGHLRMSRRHTILPGLMESLQSEDLVVFPLVSGGPKPPVGLLCVDRHYSDQPPDSDDLHMAEILSRTVGQEMEMRRLEVRLETYREDAERDYLTGIYNRRSTIKLLERELLRSRRTGEPLCLIMLDIDSFKQFNDIYGHLSGDAVLREIARLLSENARTIDVVGRYGGEEFLIVLPNTTIENAYVFAERLRMVVEHYGRSKLTQYPDNPPTISIGVSWVVPDKDSAEDGIERVDRALYGSKKGGRNRVCLEPAEVGPQTTPETDS